MKLYADGAGAERTGRPGGWAFALVDGDALVLEGFGAEARTTSLLMEFEAVHQGLRAARDAGVAELELISDCRIALDVVQGAFLPKPPHIRAPAEALHALASRLVVHARWVRAHAGEEWNEAVDAMAAWARDQTPSPVGRGPG